MVVSPAVPVDLPRASAERENVKPETIRLSVTADGKYHWNETDISDAELEPRLKAEAAKDPQPDLHIRGDKEVRYERVAQAMAAAQRAGVRKIGFVTDPHGHLARLLLFGQQAQHHDLLFQRFEHRPQ